MGPRVAAIREEIFFGGMEKAEAAADIHSWGGGRPSGGGGAMIAG